MSERTNDAVEQAADAVEQAASCTVLLATVPVSAVTWGFLTMKLWAWFVVPTFGGPALGLWTAIGIRMLVSTAAYRPSDDSKKRKFGETVSWVFTNAIVLPLMLLGMAWVVRGLAS